jgi:peptidoglycan/LPS O-acetylase OafA/YrhL
MNVAGQLWSIAVEEQFYLVWPAVVLLCGRRLLLLVCSAMILGALVSRCAFNVAAVEGEAAYLLTSSRMDGLALGGLVAVVVTYPAGLTALRRGAPAAALAGLLVLGLLFATQGNLTPPLGDWVETVGISGFVLVSGALLVSAIGMREGNPGYRLLASPALRTLGKYSFAMYLLHSFVLRIALWRWPGAGADITVYGSILLGTVALALVVGTITFALAWISWRILEEPFLQAKSLFPYGSEASAQRLSM